MKKNIFAEVLEKIGGASFVERFARKHPAQFLQLAKTELTSQPPHVAPSETELRAVIERSLLGAVGALYSKADNGSSGVRDAASSDAGAAHGNADTSHGITATSNPEPVSVPSQPGDGVTKPRPDVTQRRDRPAPKPELSQPIPGLCAAQVLGEASAPNYGLNWSQNKAWY